MARGSDSEEFASADEAPPLQKTASKVPKSADAAVKPKLENTNTEQPTQSISNQETEGGWDNDWIDFDEDEPPSTESQTALKNSDIKPPQKESAPSKGDDWDNFDDWEEPKDDEGSSTNITKQPVASEHTEKEYKALADRLSSLGDSSSKVTEPASGWGAWGNWGVSNIITGVSQITSHVSQGFASVSQVIESGMGVPDPVELARSDEKSLQKQSSMESNANLNKDKSDKLEKNISVKQNNEMINPKSESPKEAEGDRIFQIGKLVSSVTKLVETTGTAVVTGGLDTLEEIGKRTMRVLQGEEDGKKRLSTLLKETRAKMDEAPPSHVDDTIVKKKPPQFEALFDDFQGLVHLEALEMLSKQCDMKIQTLLSSHEGQELAELKETLDQVKEICELPDPDDEDDKDSGDDLSIETFKNKLLEAVRDMGVQLQFDPIITCWKNILDEADESPNNINNENEENPEILIEKAENIMHRAITNLAESSALSVQLLHRSTALLSIRERRSTADEADGLTQLTVVLSSHIGEVADLYSQKLNKLSEKCKETGKVNEFITTIFLEAGKGSSFVQDAFTLTIPILQVGAT